MAGGYLSLRERMVNALKFEKNNVEDFWALKDVSFEVQPGESIGIIGRNGAGKSTLLKILSKITPPTTGKIVSRGRIASLLEVGTGFHPELTGRENIFFNGSLLGMKRKEIEAKFDEIVDFSGVEKFLDTPLKHFSSGMQLRLAFAVAAFLDPEILIIDEVLAVGDAEFQKKCLGKMEDVSKSGRTILFVSHNLNAISSLCTTGILIDKGIITDKGIMSQTISNYLTRYKPINSNNYIENKKLSETVLLKEFVVSKVEVTTFSDFDFKISIKSETINPIFDLALLFFNSYQERVAIVDLRSFQLIAESKTKNEIFLSVEVSDLPFIEGDYSIGLYIHSRECTGNFMDLLSITAIRRMNDLSFAPYPVQVRGLMELKSRFYLNGK